MKLKISLSAWEWNPIVLCQTLYAFLLVSSLICSGQAAPPESLGIPIIQSIIDGKSSNGLKELVQSHSSKLLSHLSGVDASQTNPEDINTLINKLKPKQGQLDPVVTDVLSALERTYRDTTAAATGESSTEQFPDDTASNRVASSTEENGIIWQDTIMRPRKRNRDSNRFSSRYRSNRNESPFKSYNESLHNNNGSSNNDTEHGDPSLLPFNHVTDPNLRNHRLYDWEFETYKNFTHIDQAEDLMAEEDHATETKVSVVAAPPPPIQPSQQEPPPEKAEGNKDDSPAPSTWTGKINGSKSKRVKVKGIPHIVISLEDTSVHGYDNGQETYNLHVPMDSGEQSLHQRPREPLRHSSTENIVYVHGDSGEEDRYPYSIVREPSMHAVDERYQDGRSPHHFRPSAADLSDAVFMDPDQDFFTSTVRNGDGHGLQEQEISSETLPKRRRKKLKKITRKEEIDELAQAASRFNNRVEDRHNNMEDEHSYGNQDRANHGIHYSPEYSRNSLQGNTVSEDRARAHLGSIHRTPGPHLPLMNPSKYTESTRMKSDRVLNAGDHDEYGMMNQGQPVNPNYDQFDPIAHHHDGGIGNYYSLHSDPGLHSNLGLSAPDNAGPYGHKNKYELTSTEYLGNGNRIQNALSALNLNNIFGSQYPSKKLQASVADQVIAPGNIEDFYHPYAASDHQVNQYYEDSYATSWSNSWFILAGLIAFTAIFALLLPLFLSPGRMGKKNHRHDLDEEDLNTSTYTGSSSNNNYHYDNTNNDVNQNSDLWSEIKGVYNDLASMFRGEYSLLSKLKKIPEGPKIVYRDEEIDDDEDSDEDEEDDEKTENRVNIRNRKRNQYIKKQQQILQKQQQQELKNQQQVKQTQQQQQKQQPANQAKSNTGISKKTLVSKTKVEAGRDNKDNGKTINATSVNNLVVVSGPAGPMARRMEDEEEEEQSSPRGVTGFVIPENGTLATMAMPFINTTGYGSAADSFLREWAQVQLINNQ